LRSQNKESISNEPFGRCTSEKRPLDKSEEGEPGHKKQEESPARHRDDTDQCNSSWLLVVEFDRVKRTETGQGKKPGHGSRNDRETLRARKGAKKRDLTSNFACLEASQ